MTKLSSTPCPWLVHGWLSAHQTNPRAMRCTRLECISLFHSILSPLVPSIYPPANPRASNYSLLIQSVTHSVPVPVEQELSFSRFSIRRCEQEALRVQGEKTKDASFFTYFFMVIKSVSPGNQKDVLREKSIWNKRRCEAFPFTICSKYPVISSTFSSN